MGVLCMSEDDALVRHVHVILHHRPFFQSWKWYNISLLQVYTTTGLKGPESATPLLLFTV